MDKKKEIKPALVGNAAMFSVLLQQSINILCPATTRRLLPHSLLLLPLSLLLLGPTLGRVVPLFTAFLLLSVTHFRLEKLFRMLARTGGFTTLD